ncbi:MAG: tripartite tricarboxylate transporter TctB family protein [Desulfovibrio sp.]|nr:tripartite tricarboxylate transporter TctB family protein [Desulfovibrio sp.]
MEIKNKRDVVTSLLLVLFCAVGFYSTNSIPTIMGGGPAVFPNFVLSALLVCAIILLVRGIRHSPVKMGSARVAPRVVAFFLLFIVYLGSIATMGDLFSFLTIPFIPYGGGFAVSTCLFLIFSLLLLGRRRPIEIALVSLLVTSFIIFVFSILFEVILP